MTLGAVPDQPLPEGCDDTYTCDCPTCKQTKEALVLIGVRPDKPQPYDLAA